MEAVVNSRPLVYVGDDIKSSHVLTPADFLSMNPNNIIPNYSCGEDRDMDYEEFPDHSLANKLLEMWKQGQRNLNHFWTLWRNDYFLNLRERRQTHLNHPRKQASNLPKIGDVVLIKDDLPRGKWKIGKILELNRGKDQEIRSAKLLMSSNKMLYRALNQLYPMECPDHTGSDDQNTMLQDYDEVAENSSNVEGDSEQGPNGNDRDNKGFESQTDGNLSWALGRPVRQATLAARQKLKRWLNPTEICTALGSVAIPIAMT